MGGQSACPSFSGGGREGLRAEGEHLALVSLEPQLGELLGFGSSPRSNARAITTWLAELNRVPEGPLFSKHERFPPLWAWTAEHSCGPLMGPGQDRSESAAPDGFPECEVISRGQATGVVTTAPYTELVICTCRHINPHIMREARTEARGGSPGSPKPSCQWI